MLDFRHRHRDPRRKGESGHGCGSGSPAGAAGTGPAHQSPAARAHLPATPEHILKGHCARGPRERTARPKDCQRRAGSVGERPGGRPLAASARPARGRARRRGRGDRGGRPPGGQALPQRSREARSLPGGSEGRGREVRKQKKIFPRSPAQPFEMARFQKANESK
jgi:hypothetical protein